MSSTDHPLAEGGATPARRRPWVGTAARLGIIAAITLILLEISLNLWLARFASEAAFERFATFEQVRRRHPLRFAGHPYLDYMNAPQYAKGGTHHDARGFRGPRFATPKAPGAFRVVALGGSTTYSEFIDDDRDTYPAQLEKSLRALGYGGVEVINAGAPGYTSWESLVNLEFRVLDLEPDLLVVYDALNDIHARLVAPDHYRGDNTGYRRQWRLRSTPWYERLATVRIVLRLLGLSSPAVDLFNLTAHRDTFRFDRSTSEVQSEILAKNPPVYFERNLKSMIGIARIHGVGIMFATFAYSPKKGDYAAAPSYSAAIAEHNRIIGGLEAAYTVPVFDYAAAMTGRRCQGCWVDGRHVNAKGAAVQGGLFAEFIHERGLVPDPKNAADGGVAESSPRAIRAAWSAVE
jgi:lysophospholipase L1-like esterase